jgi:hypothetical protein
MKSNYLIKPTSGLKVDKIGSDTYLVWTPNYLGLSVPRLKYQGNNIENLKLTEITGQLKSILINVSLFCLIVLFVNLINPKESLSFSAIIGAITINILFCITLSYVVIYSTKVKVRLQLKKEKNSN